MSAPTSLRFSGLVWTFLGFFIFALLAFIAAKNVLGYNDYDTRRDTVRRANLAKLRSDEQKTLSAHAWVDKDKKIVSLPLEEVIPEELVTLQAKPLQPGSLLPAAQPQPLPAPMTNAPAGTPPPVGKTNTPPAAPPADTKTNAAPATPKM